MRNWNIVTDMNFDGIFTITDIWMLVKSLFYYPGDFILKLLIDTEFGAFLELNSNFYGGTLSGFISLFIYFYLLPHISSLIDQACLTTQKNIKTDKDSQN
ncbi:MAG: hypothetical protein ACTSXQ_02355 [Alphaproteobacteria bacterium]